MRLFALSRISKILTAGALLLLIAGQSVAWPAKTEKPCPSAWRRVIASLSKADEARMKDAIALSAQGEAQLALIRLDNGSQGSLQVWTAWALLQLGQHFGAFDANCMRNPQRA
jgi:predicted LPLAT superfamily acyltransferase